MDGDDRDFSLLSDSWMDVQASGDDAELEAELQRELSDDHVLNGLPVTAIAARKLRKEVIFWLPDEHQWALVHLTWHAETDARWPSAEVRNTWAELVELLRDAGRD